MKPILSIDIYARASQVLDRKIYLVHNLTDIDDKIIARAQEKHSSEKAISTLYSKHYLKLMRILNIEKPHKMPKVTKHIHEIIFYIEQLIEKKRAYVSNGSVYFDVKKAPLYGNLSNRKIKDMILTKDKDKRYSTDFAL
jgi:cysteinyl-tRNA synthetase